jgi:hypothetical protein
MPDSAQNLDQQSASCLLHSNAHDGTVANSRHWLDDKKILKDTNTKMVPHLCHKELLYCYHFPSVENKTYTSTICHSSTPARQLTSHSNTQVYTHQVITLAGHK